MSSADARAAGGDGAALNLPIGYLRAFVVLLVVAHHAVLAYHPFAPEKTTSLLTHPRWWPAFPVLDSERSVAVALFAGWNDVFFMALLFFLSGQFVSASVARKGVRRFLVDRLRRLGIPFVVAAGLLAPLAYYPTYLGTDAPAGFGGFAREWLALGSWPSGPAWFLWLLLAYVALAAGLYARSPGWDVGLARRLGGALERPGAAFGLLIGASGAAYLPMALSWDPLHWTAFGPFSFQTSRVLFYATYFVIGIAVGALGIEKSFLASDGALARRWLLWATVGFFAYVFVVGAVMAAGAEGAGRGALFVASGAFVVSSAASSFALVALSLRFVRSRSPMWESLRENAYGIYIVHYAFVSWLQLAVLELPLGPLTKGTIVFVAAALLSWGTSAALRSVASVRRIV